LGIFGRKGKSLEPENERPPEEEVNLFHNLPAVFDITLRELLADGEELLAVLFVPSERILSNWYPGKALVVTAFQVMVMEEGESVIVDTKWGAKTKMYAFDHIAAIEMGYALLRGRFRIASTNPQETSEIRLHWYDLNNFRAAVRLIRERMAAGRTMQYRTLDDQHQQEGG